MYLTSSLEMLHLTGQLRSRQPNASGNHVASCTYTGQKSDGTGLLYYNARYYDPALGTFLSPDTGVAERAAANELAAWPRRPG